MENTPPLTRQRMDEFREKRRKVVARVLETGETWNQASGGPSFLSLDEQSFRSYLNDRADDLGQHVAILSDAFVRHLDIGEPIPPYYAWRVAVILRRAKFRKEESRFLSAWCLHYPNGDGGRRYADLVERHRKLNSN
jgi:hypothetical protein